jgi:hypothetical protein
MNTSKYLMEDDAQHPIPDSSEQQPKSDENQKKSLQQKLPFEDTIIETKDAITALGVPYQEDSSDEQSSLYPEEMDCPTCGEKNTMYQGECAACGYVIEEYYHYFHNKLPAPIPQPNRSSSPVGRETPEKNKPQQELMKHIAGIFWSLHEIGFIPVLGSFSIRHPKIRTAPDEKMEYLLTKMLKNKNRYLKLFAFLSTLQEKKQFFFLKRSHDVIVLAQQILTDQKTDIPTAVQQLFQTSDPESWSMMYALCLLLIDPSLLLKDTKTLEQQIRDGQYTIQEDKHGYTYSQFHHTFPHLEKHIQDVIRYQQEMMQLVDHIPE